MKKSLRPAPPLQKYNHNTFIGLDAAFPAWWCHTCHHPVAQKKPWPFLFPESIAKHLKIVKSATELFSIVPKAHYDNAAADAERILKR